MNDQVDTVYPQVRTVSVQVAGATVAVEIHRVSVSTLKPTIGYLKMVFELIAPEVEVPGQGKGVKTAVKKKQTVDLKDPIVILKLISEVADDTYEIITSLCSLSLDKFMGLELDDAIRVVVAIVEENQSFFTQKVLPLVIGYVPKAEEQASEEKRG